MNILLLTVLAFSGAIELAIGVWALVGPTSFASTWLEIPQLSASGQLRGPIQVLLFVIGWVGIAMSALHLLAFAWLRSEKREAYRLSIALGSALAFLGLATFLYGRFAEPPVARTIYLLLIDGLRGALLASASILAMNAPATVRELRLPARREQERAPRSRPPLRDHRRGERESGRGRERGPGRGREREGERRGGVGGRDSRRPDSGRGARAPRAAREGERPGRQGGDRRARPGEIAASIREPGQERPTIPPSLQARPLPVRDEAEGDRWPQGRRRPGAPPDTGDVRSLGVVVTGRPPHSATRETDVSHPGRGEAGTSTEERSPLPRAPMVPRVRTEIPPARPLGPDQQDEEGDRGERDRDRRHRRRRRSSSSRATGEERPRRDGGRSSEDFPRGEGHSSDRFAASDRPTGPDRFAPVDRQGQPERLSPGEPSAPPDRFAPLDRQAPPERQAPAARIAPHERTSPRERATPDEGIGPLERSVPAERTAPPDRTQSFEPSYPSSFEERPPRVPSSDEIAEPVGPGEEPLDMLSVFGEREETGGAQEHAAAAFGRHRRPFSPHRKGRQSKPREMKIHRGLGSDLQREPEGQEPPASPFGQAGPSEGRKGEGRIGLADGIGPIDLDDTDSGSRGPDEA